MKKFSIMVGILDVLMVVGALFIPGIATWSAWLILLLLLAGDLLIVTAVLLCCKELFLGAVIQFSLANFFILVTLVLMLANASVISILALGGLIPALAMIELLAYDLFAIVFWGAMTYAMTR